jgi:hypothetical protein
MLKLINNRILITICKNNLVNCKVMDTGRDSEFMEVDLRSSDKNVFPDVDLDPEVVHTTGFFIWLNKKFESVKADYGQTPETFYVSGKTVDGIHFAVFPKFQQLKFSEFLIGNKEDYDKVLGYYNDKKIFKSFYCNLCCIEEKNNFAILDNGKLLQEKNLAAESNNFHLRIKNVEWIVSATVPQYYYSHLLMTSMEHFSTYLLFLDKKYFLSLIELLNVVSNPDFKLIFNGNFGSEISHAHVHLTNQQFEIVNFINGLDLKNPETLKTDQRVKVVKTDEDYFDLNIFYGLIQVKVFIVFDIEYLFENVLNTLFTNYISYDINGYNLSAQIYKRDDLYYVILVASSKDRYIDDEISLLVPAFSIILPYYDYDIKRLPKDRIKSKYLDPAIYFDNELLFSIDFEEYIKKLEDQHLSYAAIVVFKPPEITSYLSLLNSCDKNKVIWDNIELQNTGFFSSCINRGCSSPDFSKYKILVSWFIICTNLETVTDTAIKEIINGEFANLEKYNINSFNRLYLKGPLSQIIVEKTFQDLMLVTPKNVVSDSRYMGDEINRWINFSTNRTAIGEPSANGFVVKTSVFKNTGNYPIVIKINKNDSNRDLFFQEFNFGLQINRLRQRIPNFIITLGGFSCYSHMEGTERTIDLTNATLCSNSISNKDRPYSYILLENVNGVSFREHIEKCLSTDQDLFLALKQILLALWYAYVKFQFTHYDLHTGNILVTSIQKSNFVYKIEGGDRSVVAKNIYTIIDYGSSYINTPPGFVYKISKTFIDFKIDSRVTNLYFDIYRLISSTFETIYIWNFSLFQNINIRQFFIDVFSKYKKLFKQGELSITTKSRFGIRGEYLSIINYLMQRPNNSLNLAEIMNAMRVDTHITGKQWHWMILYNSDIDDTVRSLNYYTLIDILDRFIIRNTETLPVFFWGDFEQNDIGLVDVKKENPTRKQYQRVENLKQQLP